MTKETFYTNVMHYIFSARIQDNVFNKAYLEQIRGIRAVSVCAKKDEEEEEPRGINESRLINARGTYIYIQLRYGTLRNVTINYRMSIEQTVHLSPAKYARIITKFELCLRLFLSR